ncbi:hypothetical protein [Kurthia senegalensis]|nr:hypothetical protein [Kurthia senegalensis]
MIVGISVILLSIVIERKKKTSDDLEQLSTTIFKETSQLKRRLKIVEEELMLEAPLPKRSATQPSSKGVHQILVSQVLALHTQGYNVAQIAERSSLTPSQIEQIIVTGGRV